MPSITTHSAVLTIDVVESRKAADREGLQKRIKAAISRVNKKHKDALLAEFMITLGDEFQGAMKEPSLAYESFSEFQEALYPAKIKGGIGIGGISTKVSEKVTEMDGEAFHRSREALGRAKDSRSDALIKSSTKNADVGINVIFELLSRMKSRWTPRQREIISYLRENTAATLEEMGKRFKIRKQTVLKIINSAEWASIKNAEEGVKNLLSALRG